MMIIAPAANAEVGALPFLLVVIIIVLALAGLAAGTNRRN